MSEKKVRVNGVEYPSVVALHIPRYYLPKPHLVKQKYPESFVLVTHVELDSLTQLLSETCHDTPPPRSDVEFSVLTRIPIHENPKGALDIVLHDIAQKRGSAEVQYILSRKAFVALRPCDPFGRLISGEAMKDAIPSVAARQQPHAVHTEAANLMKPAVFDSAKPLGDQLRIPFMARLSVDVDALRFAAKSRISAETRRLESLLHSVNTLRAERVAEIDKTREQNDLEAVLVSQQRDQAVRELIASQKSVASREILQWRRDKFFFEREQQRDQATRLRTAENESRRQKLENQLQARATERASLVEDEHDARVDVEGRFAEGWASLRKDERTAAAKLLKESRIRQRLRELRG